MTIDRDLLFRDFTLIGPVGEVAWLTDAVIGAPIVRRTIDGASTLSVTIADYQRKLLRSDVLFASKSWAVVMGQHFELVAVGKSGDALTLTFEDGVVGALRRRTEPWSSPAGALSRAQIAQRLAAEAGVDVVVDPHERGPINSDVTRSADGEEPSSSWDVLGRLADDAGFRRFSDGRRLVFGRDDWIAELQPVWSVAEYDPYVHSFDFDLDVGKPANRLSMRVDAARSNLPPGTFVNVFDAGLASGIWVLETWEHGVTQSDATVTLTRRRWVLPEAPPPRDGAPGEAGEFDFLPGQEAEQGASVSGSSGNSARDTMIAYMLKQQGKPYIWGGNGPKGFDCSGIVQRATEAAGRPLIKPSRSQWAQIQRSGRVISVAEAIRTRGAMLVRMNTTPQHIAVSLGDGRTVEARGKAYGCGVFGNAAGRPWTGAGIWI